MLGNNNIVAFVATTDAAKARPFYENILGLKVTSADQFAIAFDANGVHLRMTMVREFKPHPFTVLGWTVEDIKKTITGLSAKGLQFEKYYFLEQDEQHIWTAPDGTLVAWFKDPDGNILSLTEWV